MILSSAFEKRSISCMILHDVGEAETGADAEGEAVSWVEAETAAVEAAEAIGGGGMGGRWRLDTAAEAVEIGGGAAAR